jgi:catechol 2,3-dioxygenase-like lactoylglutathione lyase family enzyme
VACRSWTSYWNAEYEAESSDEASRCTPCRHLRRSLAFYRDVLGMTLLPRPDLGPGYWLDAGGQQVHLMESDAQPCGANHFAIQVDDIDAAVTGLQEQGVEGAPDTVHSRRRAPSLPARSFWQLARAEPAGIACAQPRTGGAKWR